MLRQTNRSDNGCQSNRPANSGPDSKEEIEKNEGKWRNEGVDPRSSPCCNEPELLGKFLQIQLEAIQYYGLAWRPQEKVSQLPSTVRGEKRM